MTLYELSQEYQQAADMLRTRIMELEQTCREERDSRRRVQIDRRIRPLRSMYREARTTARYLESYYRRKNPGRMVRRESAGAKGGAGHARDFL